MQKLLILFSVNNYNSPKIVLPLCEDENLPQKSFIVI